ncbi:MAG: type II secretion system F family protein [Gemmatimonadota bacterium]
MLYLATILAALSVTLLVFGVGTLASPQPRVVRQRLRGVRAAGGDVARSGRSEARERIEVMLENLGDRIVKQKAAKETTSDLLQRAGYLRSNAVPIYFALRVALTFGLGLAVGMLASLLGWIPGLVVLAAAGTALIGWGIPRVYITRRAVARRKEIQKSLPDVLDLLVICVESGMGLNQAMLHVSEEIGPVSRAMRAELARVNFEIQTGTPRDEALRHFADRTDLADVRSLVAMLVQTDRFGTSIARSLRLHAETMRTKRRQRAEEAAAKTTIKLVFPLVLFIFPAMFVVILGPALLHIIEQLRNVS